MDDRELIASSAREVLADQLEPRRLHAFYDGDDSIADGMWTLAVEMGWLSAAVPERLGGLGLDASAGFAIVKECGRRAVPGPIFTALVASIWAAGLDEGSALERVAAEVAAGEMKPIIPALDWGVSLEVKGGAVSGTAPGVLGWTSANAALLPATQDGRRVLVLVEVSEGTVTFTPDKIWDRTRQAGPAVFNGAKVLATLADDDGAQAERLQTVFLLALASDSVGGTEASLDLTTNYTKERQQFGRPVGSFQALKHRIANVYLNILQGGRLYDYAVGLFAAGDADAGQWARVAKAETTENYAIAAEESVLLHGGVGFTWEFDCHIYLKRALFNSRAGGEARKVRADAWESVVKATQAGRSTAEISA
jgi:alkylation response protein AidB-like acyl-CoA dehydrogenase